MVFQILSATADECESVNVTMTNFNVHRAHQWMRKGAKMNMSVSSYLFAHHPTLLMTLSYDTKTIKFSESVYKFHRQYVVKTLKVKEVPLYMLLDTVSTI